EASATIYDRLVVTARGGGGNDSLYGVLPAAYDSATELQTLFGTFTAQNGASVMTLCGALAGSLQGEAGDDTLLGTLLMVADGGAGDDTLFGTLPASLDSAP